MGGVALTADDVAKGRLPVRPSREPVPTKVNLHVYNLGGSEQVARLNGVLRDWGTGLYHCGVEIHGREWSYGFSPDGDTGMFHCLPRQMCGHSYLDSLPMGEVMLSTEAYWEMITSLAEQWSGSDYDMLRRNCCHFCSAMLDELGLGPVPTWITSSAAVGEQLPRLQDALSQAIFGAPIQDEPLKRLRVEPDQTERVRADAPDAQQSTQQPKQAAEITFVVNFGKRMSVAV
eukprot:TRINITY_DN100652_c0_g1_i1.p1 TRINITY_DN100652_c0_g1~~TRINITY_DN100652_c0_g1_i1.p1  ORF type:complete len:231 (+),score=36.95 TRINITY_DN100652_c0_g1_i1:75-767(+)